MSKREIREQERRLDQMTRAEANVHERLITLRTELDALAHALDRVCMPPRRVVAMRPDMLAGPSIIPFRGRSR